MIVHEVFHAVKCDRCGKLNEGMDSSFWSDESSVVDLAYDNEWVIDQRTGFNDKHYCPDCCEIDDDDKLIVYPPIPKEIKLVKSFMLELGIVADLSETEEQYKLEYWNHKKITDADLAWISSKVDFDIDENPRGTEHGLNHRSAMIIKKKVSNNKIKKS